MRQNIDEELFVFVELKESSFEDYIKAREDVKKPGFFKLSNRLMEDDELFVLSGAECWAWVYIMSQSSIQKSSRVRLNLDKVDGLKRRFSRQDLFSAIRKLRDLNILVSSSIDVVETNSTAVESQDETPPPENLTIGDESKVDTKPEPRNVDVTPTLRARNVDVTLDGIGIGEDKELGREGSARTRVANPEPDTPHPPADPPTQPDEPFGEGPFEVAAEIQGEPAIRFVASQVPPIRQREWLARHGPSVFNESLAKAVVKKLGQLGTEDPRRHDDWLGYLENWFKKETRVAFVPKSGTPRPDKTKEPPTPWPKHRDPKQVLGGMSPLQAFRAAGGR